MSILVSGGAGYIGGSVVRYLTAKGEEVVVIDNFSKSDKAAKIDGIRYYEGDVEDRALVENIVKKESVTACIHFAAFIEVGESVRNPYKYFMNNSFSALEFFNTLKNSGVKKIVFSSTAAVYGEPEYTPIDENHPLKPTNPYGLSKLFVEKMLDSLDISDGVKFVALRYFNACGAYGRGEAHDPETHIIPLVLQAALGQRESISIFGDDYSTPDGTCVRDYIHVEDLASAHYLALKYLAKGGTSSKINLGNGVGFSVKDVIDTARVVTGFDIPVKVAARREGDPSVLIASSDKAVKLLGWEPKHTKLDEMISSAWQWHKSAAAVKE